MAVSSHIRRSIAERARSAAIRTPDVELSLLPDGRAADADASRLRTAVVEGKRRPSIRRCAATHSACPAEQVLSVIDDIYSTALTPVLWAGVLVKCANFVGGPSATLFSDDAIGKGSKFPHAHGALDPHYERLYFDQYVRLDPSNAGRVFAEIGRPVSTADLVRYEEFVKTRFYKEWMLPQGLVDFVSTALCRSATNSTIFGVFRHARDGLVDEATRARMRLIVPHIRRAVLIGGIIEQKTAEAGAFADALDGLSAGMFLVDAKGRIVHANPSGHAMLAGSSALRNAVGALAAAEADAARALSATCAITRCGAAAHGGKSVAVLVGAQDRECYVAHMLPLAGGARRRAGPGYAAVAALFVHKTAVESSLPPRVIGQTFNLTPSELRVLLGIVRVGGVRETAAALGMSTATVKTHLHRVFSKTGAGRQADLVKLVAGYANPLLG